MVDPIASKLGAAKYDAKRNDYFIDCDDKTLGNMEFTFGKLKIIMEPADYIWKVGVSKLHGCINCVNFSRNIHFVFLPQGK